MASPLSLLCLLSLLPLLLAVASPALADQPEGLKNLPDAQRIISDEDQMNMKYIKSQIANDYSDLRSIDEVHGFLEKVKLLAQKHPKNLAFASGDLKELFKFLSQEIVTRLLRVDEEPFVLPLVDDRLTFAQKVVEEDDLTKKLFGAPLMRLVESRKQQMIKPGETGNHKETNFFVNIWCKISGNCPNQ